MRSTNNHTLDTISAAAIAIASAENRVRQTSVQKRRWGSCWSIYWCFGSHNHNKRIGHAVLVSDTTASGTEVPAAEYSTTLAPSTVQPFIAPPSSPASFLQSEPPSCTQSPAGTQSFCSVSASMYSPGPASIFAIGPYAHETQLVSPPVFSAFTTEPSTAPFTPPPESIQLTTPSSPEVPFARLLDPNYQNGEAGLSFPFSHYEFQSYQLYPGSPVSHLISPCSGISGSGTSSPLPDCQFSPGGPMFLQFQIGNPPKLLNLDKLSAYHEWGSRQRSGSLTPDAVGPKSRDSSLLVRQHSDITPLRKSLNGSRKDEAVIDQRVSLDNAAEKAVSPSLQNTELAAEEDENSTKVGNNHEGHVVEVHENLSEKASAEGEVGQLPEKHRSITLGSVVEFNFDSSDGGKSDRPTIVSDWWANEKVHEDDGEPCKNWSFPMIQPGVG